MAVTLLVVVILAHKISFVVVEYTMSIIKPYDESEYDLQRVLCPKSSSNNSDTPYADKALSIDERLVPAITGMELDVEEVELSVEVLSVEDSSLVLFDVSCDDDSVAFELSSVDNSFVSESVFSFTE